eukprot:scaffold77119_cov86-Attheya_sp.AAC.1
MSKSFYVVLVLGCYVHRKKTLATLEHTPGSTSCATTTKRGDRREGLGTKRRDTRDLRLVAGYHLMILSPVRQWAYQPPSLTEAGRAGRKMETSKKKARKSQVPCVSPLRAAWCVFRCGQCFFAVHVATKY